MAVTKKISIGYTQNEMKKEFKCFTKINTKLDSNADDKRQKRFRRHI